jgi:hypothetical protein
MLVEYDSSSSDGENCDVENGQLSINSSMIGSVLKEEDDEMVAKKEKVDITRSVLVEQNLLSDVRIYAPNMPQHKGANISRCTCLKY